MGVGLGGRGKRRRNIGQNHGGAKDCGGVKRVWVSICGAKGRARGVDLGGIRCLLCTVDY